MAETENQRPPCVLPHRWVRTAIFAPPSGDDFSPEEWTCEMCGVVHMTKNADRRYIFNTGTVVRD